MQKYRSKVEHGQDSSKRRMAVGPSGCHGSTSIAVILGMDGQYDL